MRLQLALNVPNLDDAIDFYSKLFGTVPYKVRPGYANWSIDQPPQKLECCICCFLLLQHINFIEFFIFIILART